jgi:hypothetical protein
MTHACRTCGKSGTDRWVEVQHPDNGPEIVGCCMACRNGCDPDATLEEVQRAYVRNETARSLVRMREGSFGKMVERQGPLPDTVLAEGRETKDEVITQVAVEPMVGPLVPGFVAAEASVPARLEDDPVPARRGRRLRARDAGGDPGLLEVRQAADLGVPTDRDAPLLDVPVRGKRRAAPVDMTALEQLKNV